MANGSGLPQILFIKLLQDARLPLAELINGHKSASMATSASFGIVFATSQIWEVV
jgi:hypothetical protein